MPEQPLAVKRVFLSYSRQDHQFVQRLHADLEAAGIPTWLDQGDISPGDNWDEVVQHALESCPQLLLIASPASLKSQNVLDEVSFARSQGHLVVPLIASPCELPFHLRRLQWIDFTSNRVEAFDRLCALLSPPAITSTSPPAGISTHPHPHREWTRALGAGALLVGLGFLASRVWSGSSGVTGHPGGSATASAEAQHAFSASVTGRWYADVEYSWGVRKLEQLDLVVQGEQLLGSISFGGVAFARPIERGSIGGEVLRFNIKIDDHEWQYLGQRKDSHVDFVLYNPGNLPTRFSTYRSVAEARADALKRPSGGTSPQLASVEAGSYSLEHVRSIVLQKNEDVRRCYAANEFDPVDHVYVCYLLHINPRGGVMDVSGSGSAERSPSLDKCMRTALAAGGWGPASEPGPLKPTTLCFRALPEGRSQ